MIDETKQRRRRRKSRGGRDARENENENGEIRIPDQKKIRARKTYEERKEE